MNLRKGILWSLGLALAAAVPAIAAAQSAHAPAPALKYPWQPEEPQGHYTQTWHDGFRTGATAANQDLNSKVRPDLNRHVTYDHPDLAPVASEDFREGFAYAYQAVVAHRFSPDAGQASQGSGNYGYAYTPAYGPPY